MEIITSQSQIQTWLEGLGQAEAKRRESIARAIAQSPTYDEKIVAVLKELALHDSKPYVRDAAKAALEKIAEAHHLAGADIRTYLERLRKGELTAPLRVESTPAIQATPVQALPKPIQAESKLTAAPISQTIETPISPTVDQPAARPSDHPTPRPADHPTPKPSIPFDQWLLSERNIKLALYTGGFLLILAGLIFVGVKWAYLPGLAKLGVTLAVTLGLYVGGIVLFRRPALKIGGTALLAIASGFMPLNFVVTHIYLTAERGVSAETTWLFGSIACGIVYSVTTFRTRHNLFTVFAILASLSGLSAMMQLARLGTSVWMLGYALAALGLLGLSYAARTQGYTQFTARKLRIAAHLLAPIVFILATFDVVLLLSRFSTRTDNLWFELAGLLVIGVLYAVEDWRARSLYARWCAAIAFGTVAALTCGELHLSSIQTGVVLKILAALYLLMGKFLQRGAKLGAGLPLYSVATLMATFVTVQALFSYNRTPQHLALALVGDVALLALGAYLSRRVEFGYGAAWLLVAPVWIYGNLYLHDAVQRGLAFGVMLLVYTGIALWLAPRHLKWANPFLTVAAFLSVLVPALLFSESRVLTPALFGIAVLYAAVAVRLQRARLLLPAIAFVNFGLVSGGRLFYPFDFDFARALAFAFCGWGVALFMGRRAFAYLRLNDWALPFRWGALVNFGLTYALMAAIALDDLNRFGFISPVLGQTLLWSVALLGLTTWLYRRVEFLYGAVWLLITPTFIFARLYWADNTRVGLTLGALMLGYGIVGYALGKKRLDWNLPFLSAAAGLSVLTPALLYPNYPVLTFVLLGIALGYGVMAVRLSQRALVLAALAALDFALIAGASIWYVGNFDVLRVIAFLFAGVVILLFLARRALQILGLVEWAQPFAVGMLANLGLTYALAFVISVWDARTGLLTLSFANTLLADVGLLSLTAYLYRRVEFLYAAAWLLIAPVYVYAKIYVIDAVRVGAVLGGLMTAYVALGCWLGRGKIVNNRAAGASGAFLSAAALLSVLVVSILYPHYVPLTAMLLGIGFLYAICAVWLQWRWLTLAALGALNLALLTGIVSVTTASPAIQFASAIGYSSLGLVLLTSAVALKQLGFVQWRAPLYLVAGFDLALGYMLAFLNNDALFVVISVIVALVCFAMQWVEDESLRRWQLSPLLSYLGAVVTLTGIYFAGRALHLPLEFTPVAVGLGSALMVGGALAIQQTRRDVPLERLYQIPLRHVGLAGIVVTMVGIVVINDPFPSMLTFVIGAITFIGDGWRRKQIGLVYAGGAAFVAAIWSLNRVYQVTEWQAYLVPLGVLGLVIGWSELRHARTMWFQVATAAGLVILLAPLFYQSLWNVNYAVLLLLESAILFGIGLRLRSRTYVEAAILALTANGLAQFGPAFVQLERWIQIGTIGSVLVLAGLLALFRRQRLLEMRRALTSEWKMWGL